MMTENIMIPGKNSRPVMTGRERMFAALDFKPVDRVPLLIHPSVAGLHEHGQKLLNLMQACGHDFGGLQDLALPVVPPEHFDSDGRYHRTQVDDWGTTWEYRIFGVWGYRVGYPLADISRLDGYHPPLVKPLNGAELERTAAARASLRQSFFQLEGCGSIFETMQSLRPFEDVLIDITLDTPEINRLGDMLVEYNLQILENALALGADAVSFGDDFGTQQALMISPKAWRRFFVPRYRAMFEPAIKAGKRIFFHSCGQIEAILPDLAELGVNAIWPQLPLFDLNKLARRCRDLRLAMWMHPDRGDLLQRGTPQQVRDNVLRLVESFDTLSGGSWLYIEIDPGFPWDNVQALYDVAMELRK